MNFRLSILFVLLALSVPVLAQVGSFKLKGIVFQESDSLPLAGANVYLRALGKGTTTDLQGAFTISNIYAGDFNIEVSYIGMKTDTIAISIPSSSPTLNIYMSYKSSELSEVMVNDKMGTSVIQRLRAVEGMAIYASKKNELVVLDQLTINKAANISRQIYARVSGLNIWESDGAGVQLGIGGRGLSPNRNSNFNTRQNGYDISADALGYPESYYTPPVEAIERIEIVRGAASLQYGTQFGGMLNFKFKEGPADKTISLESRQTVGSFGFLNSFNSIGGTVGKMNYFGFYQYKHSDGWRPNTSLDQHNAYLSTAFKISKNVQIKGEYTHSQYLAQQPGGLTDVEFELDPRQSKRARNWFSVNWNLLALHMDLSISEKTKLNNRTFGLLAGRDAIGNLSNINLLDFGLNRDFLSDEFRNWGSETRLLTRYSIFNQPAALVIGMRYYQGKTLRMQGDGSDGSGPEFTYLNPDNLEGSDFILPSRNLAFFAENVFNLNEKWSLTPGIRFEYINTRANGYYREISTDLAGNIINDARITEEKENRRSFLFAGLGLSFRPNEHTELYSNFSQNYRAINFNDIRVNVGSLVVDQNLMDERGFTFDLGSRGNLNSLLNYDISLFHISYDDRIGTVLKREPNPVFNGLVDRTIRFRTNIADANIYGLESLIDLNIGEFLSIDGNDKSLRIFSNFSWTTASYTSDDNSVDGNEVELVPMFTVKTGINASFKSLRSSVQYAFTDAHFSDASNALRTPTAIEGVIPAYGVLDLSISYSLEQMSLETGVNNLTNKAYFTRRATGYPGPGIIPSEARSFYFTFGFKL